MLLLLPLLALAAAAAPPAPDAELRTAAEALAPALVETRRDIHRHPELGNREVRTGTLVAERLRALGLEVRHPVAKTGVVGILEGGRPGPVVAVRADLDALPIQERNDVPYKSENAGVKHACGHDAHTTIVLGTAEVLSKMKDRLPGTVVFVFQPAEEGPPEGEEGGAPLMIKEGMLDQPKVQAMYGLHMDPTLEIGEVGWSVGPIFASSDHFVIEIQGKKTHGAYPHTGLDPVPVAAELIQALQLVVSRQIDAQDPKVLTIGSVHGGNRFNIIADTVTLEGTMRTLDPAVRTGMKQRIQRTVSGVAAADYDNDGDTDLFVGGVHRQGLYRNEGGRFEEVAVRAGVASDQWVVGAGWLDYDTDGRLDLLAVNYTIWTADQDRFCGDAARGIRVYGHPKWFAAVPLSLFRNRGDGTFEDVSVKTGLARFKGRGMGLAFADYDGDGRLDVYVANDKLPSVLLHNRKDGTFEETGLLAGVSLPEHGQDVSAMGVDFRDYDNDGRPDIHVTALAGESFPLYRNMGEGLFQDATHRSLLARVVAGRSGWGNGLFDLDNDGWKDLFTADAHVNDEIEKFQGDTYRQQNGVFRNRGDGTFADVSKDSGLEAGPARAHRGAAFGDLDQDGRVDVVVTSLGAPAEVWHNESTGGGHWLDLRLVGTTSNRDGIGAVVKIASAADPFWREQFNQMTTAVGYASSSAGPVHFGTGTAATIAVVEIRWPSGIVQVLKDVAADQVLTVREPARP